MVGYRIVSYRIIKSLKHKGLKTFFETGSKKEIILDRLDASIAPRDMDLPGYYLHQLSGQEKDTWSVRMSGNWRVTFLFEGEDVLLVDYKDYH